MNKKFALFDGTRVAFWVATAGLFLAPVAAHAAGMEGITVYSMLGQPLRAEIKVSAAPDELTGMTAHLAPRDSFAHTGVAYSSVLSDFRFELEKSATGAVIRITSHLPVNEPYLDFLVELSWPSGRLTRGYTVLLDPPEVASQSLYRQATVAPTAPTPVAEPPSAEKTVASPEGEGEGGKAVSASGETTGEHVVKSGETLQRIARANLPAGVTIEQMLAALYRNNPEAFSGNNMNRLRSGAILKIPSADAVTSISQTEAKQVFQAQNVAWRNYRNKLAAAVGTVVGTGSRSVSGPVSASVESASPAEPGDKVRVSRSNQSVGAVGVSEEDLVAFDRSLQESRERVEALEKIVADLKKLLELKDQGINDLQKQLDSASPAGAPAKARPERQQRSDSTNSLITAQGVTA
ncbi:MAG: LysM peptidoglycan-binding domain-containing protein [Zoogloeaceae bacterium]|nr:LysM peptidoglycan-binding domain-containing protein [Zoogloeaceae bacterium]